MRHVFFVLLSLAAFSCGGPEPMVSEDAGLDAGGTDAGRSDGGARDAGFDDAGAPDAGVDAGVVDAGPNHPPVVNPDILVSRTTVYAGQIVELALGVTDADNDRLTFTWTGPGFFFENGNPSAQRWVSDERASAGQAVITVSVTDGRSAPIERQTTLNVTVPRFTDVFANVLSVPSLQGGQCVGCHGSMGSYQIASTKNVAWSQLVNAPHHRGGGCSATGVSSLVVPGNVGASLLYLKMTSTQPMACGDGMPAMSQVSPASPRPLIVTVGSWIRAGAPND
ncbi:MAG: hypothetical protein ACOZQL_08345 [Myxococcota bacterium]